MGNWQMEVGKMVLYISFPIGLFHYFNQPENFEEWVVKQKQQYFPRISRKHHQEFMQFIEDYNKDSEEKRMQELERRYEELQRQEALKLK